MWPCPPHGVAHQETAPLFQNRAFIQCVSVLELTLSCACCCCCVICACLMFAAGPAVLPPIGKAPGPSKFQIEHCIALPTDTSSSSSRMRLKVVQQFRRNWATGAWILDSVDLHREKWVELYARPISSFLRTVLASTQSLCIALTV
jgi:hypothetical protein